MLRDVRDRPATPEEMGMLAVCDTALSRAMRRALGLPMPPPRPERRGRRARGVYGGMAECFENRRGVRL